MRKKRNITELQKQVADLTTTVNALLEVITKPHSITTIKPGSIDYFVPATKAKLRKVQPAERLGMKWTVEEISLLLQLRKKGLSNTAVAEIMGRSPKSVCERLSLLRLGK